jgi:hypothetical protein
MTLPELHGCAGGVLYKHAALLADHFRVEIDPARVSMQAGMREEAGGALEDV